MAARIDASPSGTMWQGDCFIKSFASLWMRELLDQWLLLQDRVIVPKYRWQQPYRVKHWRVDLSPTSVMPHTGIGKAKAQQTFEDYYR